MASYLNPKLTSILGKSFLGSTTSGAVTGATAGLAGNTTVNILTGQKWNKNLAKSLIMGGVSGATSSALKFLGKTKPFQNCMSKVRTSLNLAEGRFEILRDVLIGVGETSVSSLVFDRKNFIENLRGTLIAGGLKVAFNKAGKSICSERQDVEIGLTGVAAGDGGDEKESEHYESQAQVESPNESEMRGALTPNSKQGTEIPNTININTTLFPNDPTLQQVYETTLGGLTMEAVPITFEITDDGSSFDVPVKSNSVLVPLGLASYGAGQQTFNTGNSIYRKNSEMLKVARKANRQAAKIGRYKWTPARKIGLLFEIQQVGTFNLDGIKKGANIAASSTAELGKPTHNTVDAILHVKNNTNNVQSTAQMKTGKRANLNKVVTKKYGNVQQKIIPLNNGDPLYSKGATSTLKHGDISAKPISQQKLKTVETKVSSGQKMFNTKNFQKSRKMGQATRKFGKLLKVTGKVFFVAGTAWSICENVMDVYNGEKGWVKATVCVAKDVSGVSLIEDGIELVKNYVNK